MRIEGKTFLVSGGASGLGRAAAEALHAAGANVVIADLNEATGAAAETQLGARARFVKAEKAETIAPRPKSMALAGRARPAKPKAAAVKARVGAKKRGGAKRRPKVATPKRAAAPVRSAARKKAGKAARPKARPARAARTKLRSKVRRKARSKK